MTDTQTEIYTPVKPDPGIKFRSVLVTPEKAEAWLSQSDFPNRESLRRQLVTLETDIIDGEWDPNVPQPISFDVDGNMIDGKHRCLSIINTGQPVYVWVASGVPRSTAWNLDQGVQRSLKHLLEFQQVDHPAQVAAILGLLGKYLEGRMTFGFGGNQDLTKRQRLALLEKHKSVKRSAAFVVEHGRHITLPDSVLGTCHYLFTKASRDHAEQFFESLETGADLTEGHPVLTLREQLRANHDRKKGRASAGIQFAWVIKAWNAYLRQDTVTRPFVFRAFKTATRAAESFPEVLTPADVAAETEAA